MLGQQYWREKMNVWEREKRDKVGNTFSLIPRGIIA
jgi:hypothetical protein